MSTSPSHIIRIITVPLLLFCLHGPTQGQQNPRRFPHNFNWGVATSAYQTEGAWNDDGKGESIWDRFTHTDPERILDKSNGDIACDSYHKVEEDVALIKNLGVSTYRFSLSWSRILPKGLKGTAVNPKGISHYRNLCKALIANGIRPFVTLYHWDLPQPLQDIGGWPNIELEDHFAYYAKVVFRELGDLVTEWTTFNEPRQICQLGYGDGMFPPGINSSGIAEYRCVYTIIKAHARTWHLYDSEFRYSQKGRIGPVVEASWMEPLSNSTADMEAAERSLQFQLGLYMSPIVHGNFPKTVIDRVASRSTQEGYSISRLPVLSPSESLYIKGTYDFLGINTYTTVYIKAIPDLQIQDPSFEGDVSVETVLDSKWTGSASPWLKVVPWGLRKLVNWVSNEYNRPQIVIAENGVSDFGGLNDLNRVDFYREYLRNLLDAIYVDNVNVTGYMAWTLMDNFEWAEGYTKKFGLYRVNFTDPLRSRTPKASAAYYKHVVGTGCIEPICDG